MNIFTEFLLRKNCLEVDQAIHKLSEHKYVSSEITYILYIDIHMYLYNRIVYTYII